MSRTTVTAHDSDTTQNVTIAVPVVDIQNDYSILERNVADGETVMTNIGSDPSLMELISFKQGPLKEVFVHDKLEAIYPPSTVNGYQIVAKDEWIARTTETDGTVHDDPESIYILYKTTKGANVVDGSDVLSRVIRLLGVAAPVKSSGGSYVLDSDMLDRLIHGVTKPSSAS